MGVVRLYWRTPSGLKSPSVSIMSCHSSLRYRLGPVVLHSCISGYRVPCLIAPTRRRPVMVPLQLKLLSRSNLNSPFKPSLVFVPPSGIFSALFLRRSSFMKFLVQPLTTTALIVILYSCSNIVISQTHLQQYMLY